VPIDGQVDGGVIGTRGEQTNQATVHSAGTAVSNRSLERHDVRTARLEQMVREHSVALARTVAFVVLDRQAAADITQDAFLRLYEHWDEVALHPDPVAWLYKVALNRAKDHRRALARAARLSHRLGERLLQSRETDEDSATREPWQPEGDFITVLRGLPKRQRSVAALHYVGDLSLAEVARAMGISEGAVKSHLHRAHQALREVVEEKR
jgi:RNA polymerase sigma factor (sigma-70 family)